MNFVANVPYIKCYVKKEYLYDLERGHGEYEECVLIAVKSASCVYGMLSRMIFKYGLRDYSKTVTLTSMYLARARCLVSTCLP